MATNPKTKNLPTDSIIASFRGDLTDSQQVILNQWLSAEGNKEKYNALKRVWDSSVSHAGEFNPDQGYRKFRARVSKVWKSLAVAASVAAVFAIGFTLYNMYVAVPVLTQTYACVTGKSSVMLPDGSKVILHKGSSISYDNSFSKTNREVSLEGEAYFDVAKDMKNTFVVSLANGKDGYVCTPEAQMRGGMECTPMYGSDLDCSAGEVLVKKLCGMIAQLKQE